MRVGGPSRPELDREVQMKTFMLIVAASMFAVAGAQAQTETPPVDPAPSATPAETATPTPDPVAAEPATPSPEATPTPTSDTPATSDSPDGSKAKKKKPRA